MNNFTFYLFIEEWYAWKYLQRITQNSFYLHVMFWTCYKTRIIVMWEELCVEILKVPALHYVPSKWSTRRGSTRSISARFHTYSALKPLRFFSRSQSAIRLRPSKRRPSSPGGSGSRDTLGSQCRRPPPSTTCRENWRDCVNKYGREILIRYQHFIRMGHIFVNTQY
jgi:hypothetical protein